jgi:hypothetical protein
MLCISRSIDVVPATASLLSCLSICLNQTVPSQLHMPTCARFVPNIQVHTSSLRSILPSGLQHNPPLSVVELHRDELPELDLLVPSLLEGEAREEVGRDCAHLCVCEARTNVSELCQEVGKREK